MSLFQAYGGSAAEKFPIVPRPKGRRISFWTVATVLGFLALVFALPELPKLPATEQTIAAADHESDALMEADFVGASVPAVVYSEEDLAKRRKAADVTADARSLERMKGARIACEERDLCDGDLETGVVLNPGEHLRLPAGVTWVAAVDSNGLGQVTNGKTSLYTGWNLVRGGSRFTFGASPEELCSTVPVTILEIRG